MLICVGVLGACTRDPYPQGTPQETLASAQLMVKNGEAEKIPRLVHADNPDMRRWLNTVGRLMGDLETLSGSIRERYPQEVEALQARAVQAAKEGRATSLIGQLVQQSRGAAKGGVGLGPGRGSRGAQARERSQIKDDFNDGLARLFADPYAILSDAEGRLTVEEVDDETAAILWDQKPVLPPLGMVMRKEEDGKWFIVLPTNVPGAEKFLPKDSEQWEILGKLVVTLDKMTVDLDREVRDGRHANLQAVSRRAGEMTFVPAVMVVYAYGKYAEEK